MGPLLLIGTVVTAVIAFLLIVGLAFSKFYKRSTKQSAFVRTGKGGQKVIMDGGAIVLPVLHEYIAINMQTLKLIVNKSKNEALITLDRMRVDVIAEFYVRVKPDEDAVAIAARTLGESTLQPKLLAELIEGKFVDALRSVAAKMSMNQLHENRSDFVQDVQATLSEDLTKNGLELESVSLTGLDQTDKEFFNPNNAFDAEGLKMLTEVTETKAKERNDIVRDNEVAIAKKDLEAKQETLDIQREREYAELSTAREIAVRKASQEREISETQAFETKAAEIARIEAERETGETEIAKEQALAEKRISKSRAVEEADIAKSSAVEQASIERDRTVTLAEQDKLIVVAQKSEEESVARAEAERARAKAVEAAEAAITVQATAQATRVKDVAVIEERGEAEKIAARTLVSAEAEKVAAEDRAEARITVANADREANVIEAEGEASRIIAIANAKAVEYETEADGKAAINEAAGNLPQAERDLAFKLELVKNMKDIVAAAAKPIGDIDSFRVVDMRGGIPGLGGGEVASVATTVNGEEVVLPVKSGTGGSLPQQIVDALVSYKISMPLLTQLSEEIGVDLENGLSGIPSVLTTLAETETVVTPAKKSKARKPAAKSTNTGS